MVGLELGGLVWEWGPDMVRGLKWGGLKWEGLEWGGLILYGACNGGPGIVRNVPNPALYLRACLHYTGDTFASERVHSGSLSWLYICLHDTTKKCHAGASHPGSCTGARISLRNEISQRYHVNAKLPSVSVRWNG